MNCSNDISTFPFVPVRQCQFCSHRFIAAVSNCWRARVLILPARLPFGLAQLEHEAGEDEVLAGIASVQPPAADVGRRAALIGDLGVLVTLHTRDRPIIINASDDHFYHILCPALPPYKPPSLSSPKISPTCSLCLRLGRATLERSPVRGGELG
jgi:hypothetical protein